MEEVWSYRDWLVFLQHLSDVRHLKRRWLLCRHRNRGLLSAILKVRFQMIFRMPLFSWAKFQFVYFGTWNGKQVMGNIFHGTQLNTLLHSYCFANVQALGHDSNLSPNTPLRLSQRLIETLPSCPRSTLIWIAKPTSRWYTVCWGKFWLKSAFLEAREETKGG